MEESNQDRHMNGVARELGLGPTARHPFGSIGPSDQGELKTAMMVKDGKLVLVFGTPVSWLAMEKEQALAIAEGIRRKAMELP